MSPTVTAPLAVFDPGAVSSLTGHPDDLAFAHVFVDRFRRLLPERVRRIRQALLDEEVKEALDAVLSLKVSACTVGAEQLCAATTRIEAPLRRSDLVGSRVVAEELVGAALRADKALAAFLAAARD